MNLDCARFDFGHLGLEQTVHERPRRSGDPDLRLLAVVLRVEDDDQHRPARVQLFARYLLLRRHHPLSSAQVDIDGSPFGAVDHSSRQLSPVLGHVPQDLFALQVVDVAQHGMLGGLRSHSFEVLGWQLFLDDGAVWLGQPAAHM